MKLRYQSKSRRRSDNLRRLGKQYNQSKHFRQIIPSVQGL